MKITREDTLPPWIDVTGNANKEYWLSPAMPWLPVHDSDGMDEFDGLVLTALLVDSINNRKFVEMRLERRPFAIGNDGAAVMCELGQTIAYGSMALNKFLKATEIPLGRTAMSRIFTFYEDDLDVITVSAAGNLMYSKVLVANVCRGYDKPKRFFAGQGHANMTFLFDDDSGSFEKWREGLKEKWRKR